MNKKNFKREKVKKQGSIYDPFTYNTAHHGGNCTHLHLSLSVTPVTRLPGKSISGLDVESGLELCHLQTYIHTPT